MLPSILFPLDILKKGGGSILNLSKKIFLAGIGTLSLSKEKANKIADELIEKGELSKDESKEFIINLLSKAEQEKGKLLEKIKPGLEKINFVSKKQVDELEKKINELENKIESLTKTTK